MQDVSQTPETTELILPRLSLFHQHAFMPHFFPFIVRTYWLRYIFQDTGSIETKNWNVGYQGQVAKLLDAESTISKNQGAFPDVFDQLQKALSNYFSPAGDPRTDHVNHLTAISAAEIAGMRLNCGLPRGVDG